MSSQGQDKQCQAKAATCHDMGCKAMPLTSFRDFALICQGWPGANLIFRFCLVFRKEPPPKAMPRHATAIAWAAKACHDLAMACQANAKGCHGMPRSCHGLPRHVMAMPRHVTAMP
jgi:hypothetical protein